MTSQPGLTFSQILARVRRRNVRRMQARAFTANRIAKISRGRSRAAAYRIKDKAMHSLLKMDEASPVRFLGRLIALQFIDGGGLLHFRPPHINQGGKIHPLNTSALFAAAQEDLREEVEIVHA